jgi:hypothetical protein
MTKAELFEQIRALLLEPQVSTVSNPWHFSDEEIVPQVRSAIRHLRVKGFLALAVMDLDGQLTTEPDETEGMLISYFVAEKLLTGSLVQKLNAGELGVIFKAGSDLIDTKQAAKEFSSVAVEYGVQFDAFFIIAQANADGGVNNTFGDQVPYSTEP